MQLTEWSRQGFDLLLEEFLYGCEDDSFYSSPEEMRQAFEKRTRQLIEIFATEKDWEVLVAEHQEDKH